VEQLGEPKKTPYFTNIFYNMTFEKNGQITEINLRTWVIEFPDWEKAVMQGFKDIRKRMDRLTFIESKWYRQVICNIEESEFAILSLS